VKAQDGRGIFRTRYGNVKSYAIRLDLLMNDTYGHDSTPNEPFPVERRAGPPRLETVLLTTAGSPRFHRDARVNVRLIKDPTMVSRRRPFRRTRGRWTLADAWQAYRRP
jgi:hypothetical protein